MYGQIFREVGRRGPGLLRFGGATLCWGRSVTFHSDRSVGIPLNPSGSLGKGIHCPIKALVAAADEEQRVQGLAFPRASEVGVIWLVLPGVRVEAWVVRGGSVVGGEEGVGAVHHPVASWCVVVGGGEGVVQIVHEGCVRGGGWLLVLGRGDVPRDVVPEVAQAGQPGDQCFPFPLFGVARGGAGSGLCHVGHVVANAALGVHPPRHGLSH